MQSLRSGTKGNRWLAGITFLVLLTLIAWLLMMPNPRLDVRGTQVWIEIIFLIILYVYASLVGLMRFLLTYLDPPLLTYLLCFGSISVGVMILGLIGWLNAGTIFFWPDNDYAFHDRFSTIGLEIIHPALWLACLFPFVWRSSRKYDLIVLYTVLIFISWAINSQVIRFLIPLTAFLSILAGAVIETFPVLWKNLIRFGLLGGFMLFNLLFQMVWFQEKGSLAYLSGTNSASEYLQNMNYDARAIEYIQELLKADEKALFLWDGRSYYCDARCVPDDKQSTAVRLAFGPPPPELLANDLHENGMTHLLLSSPDANWFITYHDPHGVHRQALDYFADTFFPACGNLMYSDQGMSLYEVTCR